MGSAFGKADGPGIGGIMQLFDGFMHPVAGSGRNGAPVVEHLGNGGGGNTGFLCDITDCYRHGVLLVKK